ncbi:DegV family protein [Mycoplasmoides pirum]|uniref:DegV family protein n=1 Tax=Mycoplasmoides pirum TaxID=2122 RepID=UPI000698567E|nr:DegV family protein [Mycoplasmoides pirum]
MKIAYLIDSSASINEDPSKNIYMVPLEIIENLDKTEITYKAGIDIDIKTLSEKISKGATFKTGQSPIGVVEEKIKELLEKYDHIIGIPIDRQLSGTYNSWQMLENQFGSNKFHVIDGLIVEQGIKFLIDEIEDYLKNNEYDIKKIDELIEKEKAKIIGVIVVNDVSQLVAGGRLKGWKAFLIKTLKIKILIKLFAKDGLLEYFDKCRDDQEAKQIALDYIDSQNNWKTKGIKRIGISTSIVDSKENEKIVEEYKKLLPKNIEIKWQHISSIIAVHTGMNGYAILIQSN